MGGREDDHNWPEPDRVGRQELEVKLGKEHISFTVSMKKRMRSRSMQREVRRGSGMAFWRVCPPPVQMH